MKYTEKDAYWWEHLDASQEEALAALSGVPVVLQSMMVKRIAHAWCIACVAQVCTATNAAWS